MNIVIFIYKGSFIRKINLFRSQNVCRKVSPIIVARFSFSLAAL